MIVINCEWRMANGELRILGIRLQASSKLYVGRILLPQARDQDELIASKTFNFQFSTSLRLLFAAVVLASPMHQMG